MGIDYLDNPFCQLKPLFPWTPEKKNLLVSSLFRMNTPYKKFKEYTDGLKMIQKTLRQELPDFRLRLFVDQNVLDDPDLKWLQDQFELVLFSCPDFLEQGTSFHRGTFATMVRFFPIFNFPNNDVNHMMILDADIYPKEIKQLIDEYKKVKDRGVSFHYHGSFNAAFFSFGNPFEKPHIFAGRMLFFQQFEKQILIDFLNAAKKDKIRIQGYRGGKVAGKQFFYFNELKNEKQFIYGIDEYFLNHQFLTALTEQNLTYSTYFFYSLASFPYFFGHLPEAKEWFSFVMGKYYREQMGLAKNLKFFDKLFYKRFKSDERIKYITQRFYYLIQLMDRDKMYKLLSRDQIRLLRREGYFGLANCEQIIFSDKQKPITLAGCIKYEELMKI